MRKFAGLGLAVLAAMAMAGPDAMASGAGGGSLPYESALETLQQSVTGPFAKAIALIGIVVAGGVLIIGGDMNGFFRSACVLVLVISLIVAANAFLSGLYSDAATIGSVSGGSAWR
jgi:type IV secretion system protein VirB2